MSLNVEFINIDLKSYFTKVKEALRKHWNILQMSDIFITCSQDYQLCTSIETKIWKSFFAPNQWYMLINNLRSWGQPMTETSRESSLFLFAESLLISTIFICWVDRDSWSDSKNTKTAFSHCKPYFLANLQQYMSASLTSICYYFTLVSKFYFGIPCCFSSKVNLWEQHFFKTLLFAHKPLKPQS